MSFNFAIITKPTELILDLDNDIEKILISPGNLVKILQNYSNKYVKIQVMDYSNKNIIWENLYKCHINNLRKIHDNFFPFLIAIQDPEERLLLALRSERIKNILSMKIDDIVTASGEPFRKNISYDCIIRYIGLVPEIGPGYYFGLEILNLDNGYSPQAQHIQYVFKYMHCDPELSLILSANWIHKSSNEIKRKFSTRELFCGTLDRVQTALGLNNNSTETTLKQRNVLKRRQSFQEIKTSQEQSNQDQLNFIKNSQNLNEIMDGHNHNHYPHYFNPPPYHSKPPFISSTSTASSSSSSSTSASTGTVTIKKDKSTNTNFPSAKQNDKKEFAAQSDDLISLENDEYSRYVENYERGIEHKQQQIIPTSILKQTKIKKRNTISNNNNNNSNNLNNVKSNTIMSLEDRDIVVIDRADIKESVMNESEVIVVDNPSSKDVDLIEILGSNWPTSAGDAGTVLNSLNNVSISVGGGGGGGGGGGSSSNSSSSNYNIRCERNKSGNPISHFVSSKTTDRRSIKESPALEMNKIPAGIEKKIRNSEPIYDVPNSNSIAVTTTVASAIPQVISITPENDVNEVEIGPSPLNEIPGSKLGIGSMVEVSTDVCEDLYGVIRWIGYPHGSKSIMVGVELEDDQLDRPLNLTDGTHNSKRLFKCPNGRALFVYPNQCSKDRRFLDIDLPLSIPSISLPSTSKNAKMFGQVDCPIVPGAVAPLKIYNLEDLEAICGKFKGIQGHHNSCYLDATLFSMFTFTSVFDSLLFRPPEPEDITHYEEVQKVLREEIVNPLRKNVFVRADRVMKLRQLLEKLSSVSGLTSEEKDPEEFLNSLLAQILRAEPYLKLSSGQDAFFYQLFVEKDERLNFPTVQQLFEQSFLSSDIKLKEVPSCLIIQMPRFGKNYKMYPRILPSQVLDVTDIIEDSPRQCSVCGKLAEYECRECFGILQCGVGLESTAFCKKCLETVHSHAKRTNHAPREISVPQDFKIMAEHLIVPRLFMELFAVVCIETSHYVAFVKAGSGLDAPWCFFDSMADRKGERNGYNIPEMVPVPDLPQWLSEEGARTINEAASNDKMLPEHAKRLLCDAYMCMYQSTDVMMYR